MQPRPEKAQRVILCRRPKYGSIIVVAVFTLLLSACGWSPRITNVRILPAYDQGKQHLAAGHIGLAVQQFERALAQDPRSVPTLNALAAAHDRIGRFDLAERYYRRALRLDPHTSQTLNNLGVSYLLQQRYDLAAVYLAEARALEPGNPAILNNQAQATAALRETLEASLDRPRARPAVDRRPLPRIPRIERIDAAVQRLVLRRHAAAIETPPKPIPRPDRILVANAAGRRHMAARMRAYLRSQGVRGMRIANAETFDRTQSRVAYREHRHRQQAAAVAALLGSTPTLVQNEGQAPDIVIELGHDLLAFDDRLWHSGAD